MALGLSRQKAQALIELARALVDKGLHDVADLDDAAAIARLCQLRGIERWAPVDTCSADWT